MSIATSPVRVPLRLRVMVHDAGADDVRPCVRCPEQDRFIDAARCTSCPRLRAMSLDPKGGGSIECTAGRVPDPSNGEDARADLAERAARTPLRDVMAPVTTCVAPGTSVRRARALLLSRGLHAVPVVDANVGLVGIVSRSDLVSLSLEHRVDAIMPARVHALPEDAPISYAIALMAYEGIHEVPVVTCDGEVVGMITANDALRWTAGKLGYVDEIASSKASA